MVSTSGSQLLAQESVKELCESLLPLTTVLTPNVPEAKLILWTAGKDVPEPQNVEGMIEIAKALQSLGPRYVLVKGGHLPLTPDGSVAQKEEDKAIVVDVLYGDGTVTKIETVYQNSKNTHGTGCSLACMWSSQLDKFLSYIPWPELIQARAFFQILLNRNRLTKDAQRQSPPILQRDCQLSLQ